MAEFYSDLRLDMLDETDGKFTLYNSSNPEKRYEVTNLLDCDGEETDDIDFAVGGVVKINDGCFMVFQC